jgi:Family of unknown function (DUF6011)
MTPALSLDLAVNLEVVADAAREWFEDRPADSYWRLRPTIRVAPGRRNRPDLAVRLWAKQHDGSARLVGFRARMGQTRSGKRLIDFGIRERDGALVSNFQLLADHPNLPPRLTELEELSRRMLDAKAVGRHEDPIAVLARNVVAQARATFCACCGRLLTDPVSVESGIGPECGATFQAVFRARWRAPKGAS